MIFHKQLCIIVTRNDEPLSPLTTPLPPYHPSPHNPGDTDSADVIDSPSHFVNSAVMLFDNKAASERLCQNTD